MPKSTARRSPTHAIQVEDIDPQMLKRAKEILGLDSDAQVVNHALSALIVNDEMESAIDQTFRTVPYFRTS